MTGIPQTLRRPRRLREPHEESNDSYRSSAGFHFQASAKTAAVSVLAMLPSRLWPIAGAALRWVWPGVRDA